MNYNGNQLTQVDNGSDEDTAYEGVQYHGGNLLTYDENGCLTADLDKNISSIQYNSLNLPTYMRLSTASASIRYQYDSKGNKLQETRISRRPKMRHETSYCGNFVFENKALKRILVDGGFIYFGENDTTYHYFLKDHLGSNRAVVNQKTGQVVEKYDYYPFGKQHGDYHTGYIHPYRYNGKEMESMMGIDWLYYGARMMEPEWGRFTIPDPLAEEEPGISPYVYCENNPVNAIDPDGNITLFVNGWNSGLEGGLSLYWGGFDKKIKNYFHDNKCRYFDGSIGGAIMTLISINQRVRDGMGFLDGRMSASSIIKNLARDKDGNIIEKIRVVSHSMGGAYAKGLVRAIIEYAKKHPELCEGLAIDEYDFAPYQSKYLEAIDGVETFQYSHKNDAVAHNKREKGNVHYMKTSEDENDNHSIQDFTQYINSLPEGHYIFKNGQFVKVK